MKKTRKILDRMLDAETPLKSRLFQLLSAIALAEFLFVSGYTIVSGGDGLHISIMLIGMTLFAVTVALTFKTGKMRLGTVIAALLYFSLYPLTFFSSGGMYGGAPVVFAFALVYVFLVTGNWERVVSLACCVAASGVCYLLSVLRPELLDRHTATAEHIESFLSILLVVLLFCTLFSFVTAVYIAENRIVQRQKKEIENLNQAQKRFFSGMSHEIRTPVNAIIGLTEMTLREPISDEVRENAENIEIAGRTLLQTINEILDMSRLETGRLELTYSDYRTTGMLSDVVGMTWLRAKEKELDYRIEVDPKLPSVLHGDEMRIKQILLNVITNAVKYTKSGSVTLKVGCGSDDTGSFIAVFEVTDTGIGIREEDIPHLFTAYLRVDEQNNRAIEGTGLGLSIVKQLLDMMGGTVSVTSTYGEGSTFRIEIPQTVVDEAPVGAVDLKKTARTEVKEEQSAFVATDMKILTVDDTPMNLMVVKKLLRETKASVDEASSGAEALRKTLENRYDVILIDHQMPEMDGIECLRRIRSQENGLCRESRIICLTANVGSEIEQLCMKEGFDGFLTKPVRGEELIKAISRPAT